MTYKIQTKKEIEEMIDKAVNKIRKELYRELNKLRSRVLKLNDEVKVR